MTDRPPPANFYRLVPHASIAPLTSIPDQPRSSRDRLTDGNIWTVGILRSKLSGSRGSRPAPGMCAQRSFAVGHSRCAWNSFVHQTLGNRMLETEAEGGGRTTDRTGTGDMPTVLRTESGIPPCTQ